MNTLRIDLCNPDLLTDPQELREALQAANRQIVQLGTQLDRLTRGCNALVRGMTVMCEAYVAGDTTLVDEQVSRFAKHYQQSLQKGVMH